MSRDDRTMLMEPGRAGRHAARRPFARPECQPAAAPADAGDLAERGLTSPGHGRDLSTLGLLRVGRRRDGLGHFALLGTAGR